MLEGDFALGLGFHELAPLVHDIHRLGTCIAVPVSPFDQAVQRIEVPAAGFGITPALGCLEGCPFLADRFPQGERWGIIEVRYGFLEEDIGNADFIVQGQQIGVALGIQVLL